MKKYALSILLYTIFLSKNGIAQSPVFEWGLYIGKNATEQSNTKIIYAEVDFFYTVYEVPVTDFTKAPVIEKFNNKYERIYSKMVNPPTVGGEPLRYRKTEWVNDNMYLFYTGFYKKEQQYRLYYIIADKEGNFGEPQQLDYVTAEKRGVADFDIQVSENKNNLLVVKTGAYVKGAPTRQATVVVYSMKEKTNYQKTFDVSDAKFSLFKSLYVNNEGGVMLVRETSKENYEISNIAYFIHPNLEKVANVSFGEPTKMPFEIDIKTANDGNIVIGGLYSENLNEKVNGTKSHGTFLCKYDKNTGAPIFTVFQAYDQEIISRMKINGANGLRSFILKALLTKEDGGYFVVAEEFWTKEGQVMVNSVAVPTIQYNAGPIIVTQLSTSGTKEFQKIIIKQQQSQDDLGRLNSILSFTKANTLYLFYNDYAYKYDDKKQVFIIDQRLNAPMPVLMKVNSKGETDLDALENSKVGGSNGTTFFRSGNYYIKNANTIIVNAISNKYFTYGKIVIE